ncbi:MAG: IS3 family transposase [Deltaproteobacteria bacterium]|nr:IS3 family transposase [Deltaproteobacteria bacterium]
MAPARAPTPPPNRDPEVVATARRRVFTAEYKLRILRQADACTQPGELGALLRHEGLYSSHLTEWRRARDAGGVSALQPAKRGPKAVPVDERDIEVKQLRREVARLQARLERAEVIIDVQKKVAFAPGDPPTEPELRREKLMEAALQWAPKVGGLRVACGALGVPRASLYRGLRGPIHGPKLPPKPQPRALSDGERQAVLNVLNSERFSDKAPGEVYSTLLDEGVYHCTERTMYRILDDNEQVRERRNQLRHPEYTKPELLATGCNEVWSWDITKLKGPAKWTYFYLYVILDIFSRKVTGWMLADRESATLATALVTQTCEKEGISEGQLTLHADRGSAMKSLALAELLANLGITKTHSRPHVSDDNPYSESQFKTLKTRPEFPKQFGAIEDARAFCRGFFRWYNHEHRHSGIAMLTPVMLHSGHGQAVLDARMHVRLKAYAANPRRFVRGAPTRVMVPEAAWINPPRPGKAPAGG